MDEDQEYSTIKDKVGSSTLPVELVNLPVKVGDCIVSMDFQVAKMQNCYAPFILERSFLATAGVILDYPLERVSFVIMIEKKVFYYPALPGFPAKHTRYIPSKKIEVLVKNHTPQPFDEDEEYSHMRQR